MRIVGIDPALSITGYGIIDVQRNNLILIEAGIIKTKPTHPIHKRLETIYCSFEKLLNEFKPDTAVLEKVYAHYRHPSTAFILGEARGVICLACVRKGIELFEYTATRVKKAILGRGLAKKYQMQEMVTHILGLGVTPRYNDVTDALALALTHSYFARNPMRFS